MYIELMNVDFIKEFRMTGIRKVEQLSNKDIKRIVELYYQYDIPIRLIAKQFKRHPGHIGKLILSNKHILNEAPGD